MAALSRVALDAYVAAQLPTNGQRQIQASTVRGVLGTITDSVVVEEDAVNFRWNGAALTTAINVSDVFTYAEVWNASVDGGISRGIAFGTNTAALKANWPVVRVVGATVTDVADGGGQNIGIISYASTHTIFALNHLDGVNGASTEGDGFYTKSPNSIVIGNFARGLVTSSASKYYFNHKGERRGDGGHEGYGGTWGFNVAVGNGTGVGMQSESGETTFAFNHLEALNTGVELGSRTADMDLVVGNKGTVNGETTSRGLTGSTTTDAGIIASALNRWRGAYDATKLSSSSGATIVGFLSLGDQADEVVHSGFDITGQTATPMQGVRIVHPFVSGGTVPITLTDILGGMVDAPYLTGYSDDRPIRFTRAKDIYVRGHRVRLQLSGTSATNLFRFTLAAGDAVSIRVLISGRATDDTQAFAYTVDAAAWNSAGTVTVLGTTIVTGAGSMSMVGPTVDGSTNDLRIRMAAGTGLTWDTTAVLDLLKY